MNQSFIKQNLGSAKKFFGKYFKTHEFSRSKT